MIIGKILKFGYGDIAVGSNCVRQSITFQQFKPHEKCGDAVSENVEWVGEKIILEISYEEYCEFINILEKVSSQEIANFIFKGYTFDFTYFNEKSIKVCRKHLDEAMKCYFRCMAA